MKKTLWVLLYIAVFIGSAVLFGPMIYKARGADESSRVKWNDSVGTIMTDFSYGEKPGNKFDLYLPADKSRSHYGLVGYFHGGGFHGGDKEGDAGILKWLASRGYVGAGINYTLNVDGDPSTSILNMTLEIKEGMNAAVEKAEELGYHIDKVATGGGSAGSTLSMVYAFRDAPDAPVPVAFTFQAAGPTLTDPREFGQCKGFETQEDRRSALKFFNVFLGLDVKEEDLDSGEWMEKIKPVSPALQVNENTVPILFSHGCDDHIVIYKQAEHLLEALDKHQVPYTFIQFDRSGHNMGWQPKKQQEFFDSLKVYLNRYMPL